MKSYLVAAALVAAAVCLTAVPIASAEEAGFELRSGDTVKSVLENCVGKPVTVVMVSGQEMTGVVVKVGDQLVHLSKLSGRDFYDAAIVIDKINGVVLKVRGK